MSEGRDFAEGAKSGRLEILVFEKVGRKCAEVSWHDFLMRRNNDE